MFLLDLVLGFWFASSAREREELANQKGCKAFEPSLPNVAKKLRYINRVDTSKLSNFAQGGRGILEYEDSFLGSSHQLSA
jgi:hypothetical protein